MKPPKPVTSPHMEIDNNPGKATESLRRGQLLFFSSD